MKKTIAALLGIAAIAFSQGAIGQTVTIKPPDRVVNFEGAANSPFTATFWSLRSRTIAANACGVVVVPTLDHSMQVISLNGNFLDYQSLPVQTLPSCSGGILKEPRTANFKLADGKTVLVNQTGSVNVQFLSKTTRTGTFNACGLKSMSIKNAENIGADSIQIDFGGQTQSVGDLPGSEYPPICRKVGNNSVKYVKQ